MQKLIFFDLDGTLIDNPSSEKLYLFWLFAHGHIKIKQMFAVLKFLVKWVHKFKLEVFVKNKAYLYGLPIEETVQKAKQFTAAKLLSRLRPCIVERLKQHQAEGDIVILLTGAPRFIADVFAEQLEIVDVRAADFSCFKDRFNDLPPLQHPFAQEKVTVAQEACDEYDSDIRSSVAYANSIYDLALMEKVGQAIAVTPDRKLRYISMQKKWEILDK
jgi:HAD superfamily phosphoserine phosphatase-like hydrolase